MVVTPPESPGDQKSREQLYTDLWWLSQELDSIANALGAALDLAEMRLRAQANLLRDVIAPLGPEE